MVRAMPQAPAALRAKFPGSEVEAWEVLEKNFTDTKGVIRKKDPDYQPTKREMETLDYLWLEWDYTYACWPQE
jgi:hypothetical protein